MMIKIGEFRLAPRPRYVIEKEQININLTEEAANSANAACGSGACASSIKNREIVFEVTCPGNGDPAAATRNYNALQVFLDSLCNEDIQDYYRQIWDEEPRIFPIVRGYIKDLDLNLEYLCEGIRRGEVHLITADTEGIVETSIYNYTVNKSG